MAHPELQSSISAESNGIFTPTRNMMGWQQNSLDEYLTDFVEFSSTCQRPVADLGAAYGFLSGKLLEAGATVITNDLEPEHLTDFASHVTPEEQLRLTCLPGSLLNLDLEKNSLDGIVAARVLHFFPIEEIRTFFRLCYTWLAKGGQLCVTSSSPYRGTSADFQKEYEEKVQRKMEWPGVTTTASLDTNRQKRIFLSQTGYRFDPEVLRREAERVGFRVLRCSYYASPFLPDEFRSADGLRDGVGLIAEK